MPSTDRSTAIRDAAHKLFAERGYRATSMRAIAKTADVSLGLAGSESRPKFYLYEKSSSWGSPHEIWDPPLRVGCARGKPHSFSESGPGNEIDMINKSSTC